MKKLIEYLESRLNMYDFIDGRSLPFAEGYKYAIELIKSHDPWIPVSELPPPNDEPEFSGQNESINVLFSDESGNDCEVGYYDFDENKIVVSDGYEHHFTKWTYLPEVNT